MASSIIFDWGNVIAKFNNDIFIQYLASYTSLSAEELRKRIYEESGACKRYETGLITSEEFFEQIKKISMAEISQKAFAEIYSQKFTLIPETLEIYRELKKQGLKIGLLSNTSELDYESGFQPIMRRAKMKFDAVSLSFKVGAMKPDKRIFQDMLGKLRQPPERCVYIDDIGEYVNAARKIGMNAILYKDSGNLIKKLGELGVEL